MQETALDETRMRGTSLMSPRRPTAGPGSLPRAQSRGEWSTQGLGGQGAQPDRLGNCGENLQSELLWTGRGGGGRRRKGTIVTLVTEPSADSGGCPQGGEAQEESSGGRSGAGGRRRLGWVGGFPGRRPRSPDPPAGARRASAGRCCPLPAPLLRREPRAGAGTAGGSPRVPLGGPTPRPAARPSNASIRLQNRPSPPLVSGRIPVSSLPAPLSCPCQGGAWSREVPPWAQPGASRSQTGSWVPEAQGLRTGLRRGCSSRRR